MLRRLLGLCFLATLLAVGCDSDGGSEASVTPSASATATSTVFVLDHSTPTATSAAGGPTATEFPVESIPFRAWLADLESGELHEVYEDEDLAVWSARFEADDVVILNGTAVGRDGQPVTAEVAPLCIPADELATLDGVEVSGWSSCAYVGPSGRYATYGVDAGEHEHPGGHRTPMWDQWVLDLETGERWLAQAGIVDCGGCDGAFGMTWSPDGRFFAIGDLGGPDRVFLVDTEARTTRLVAHGTQHQHKPAWSPNVPGQLLVRGEDGAALLLDEVAGTEETLPLAWPARFDPTGQLIYSPAGDGVSDGPTLIYDLRRGAIVAELSGVPDWSFLWNGDAAVVGTDEGFVAAIPGGECEGTAVYRSSEVGQCIEGALGAVPSNDGRRVAYSLATDEVVSDPRRGTFTVYEVVVFDEATASEIVVAERVVSGPLPPRLIWNDGGDLLLIIAPHFAGI